ncbi:hypothetical protein FHS24_001925 [Psychrobacter luti]|uniref:Uncharacterized protein n=1 Tax=Psychrobacter luti TaxID=198481 RepID=A0A839TE76_9GAMM|nr:hypothetical protein [Psychrobacter luti]MBB3107400.1 hypothetical protein [Psychrobacter luti]
MNTALSTQVHNVYPAQPVFVDNPNPVFDQSTQQYISSKIIRFVGDEYIRDVKNQKRSIEDFHKGLSKIGESDAKSLLYIKNYFQGRSWENISFDGDDYANQLIFHLKYCDNPLEEFNNLVRYKIDNILPETYLEWFKNDLRCSLFLAHLINHLMVHEAYKGRQELIQAVADFLRYNIYFFNNEYMGNLPHYSLVLQRYGDQRTASIETVKSVYLKNRTENFDWIDPKNDQMIDWSYKYLCGKGREYIILKGIFFPENTQEKYELILASLDVLSNVDDRSIGTKNKKGFSLRAYVLFSMEKAWRSQKQYAKERPSSENDSVKIYKPNIPKLEALMAYSGLTLKQMVNNSIEQMYDQLIANNSDTLGKDDASG